MKQISIRTKLGALLIIPVMILTIAFAISVMFSKDVRDELKQLIFDKVYSAQTNLIEADRDLYQANLAIIQMVESDTEKDLKASLADYKENVGQITDRVQTSQQLLQELEVYKTLGHEISGNTMEQNYIAFQENFERWQSGMTAIIKKAETMDATQRQELFTDIKEADKTFATARNNLDELEQLIDTNAKQSLVALDDIYKQGNTWLLVGISIVILLVVIIGIFVVRGIVRAIQAIMNETEKIAYGDLTGKNIQLHRQDEFGKLEASVNTMKNNLRALVKSVDDATGGVVESSNVVSAAVEETTVSIDNVAKTLQSMAKSATQGARDAETTNDRVHEVSHQVELVTQYTTSMISQSKDATAASEKGMAQVQQLRETANASNQVLVDVNHVINELLSKVTNIEGVIDVITGIAEQTNLLALNASIEAARAGEHGKGFAVVADEVRKLAEASANATTKIRDMIQLMLNESSNASSALERTLDISQRQEQVTIETEKVFTSIQSSIDTIMGSIHEVSQGMQNIMLLQGETAIAIESMTAITEQTATTTDEVSASANEQSKAIESVARTADELQVLSKELQGLLNRFSY
ncbi:methyl-accepting chemotaxis protein [Lysinibacillus piscis]|uniref:Chemotaxis protein n=1 Tax=Lysinibacillus piscis TaxID=2518931 RepID=A0ABQ5NPX7_9BACI|nr:methyl-accepting chemotaxis protein [Lysinibacillus sp. KH24]GLC90417.1 chemotaxis protein [Lysinibacillus sp. KH24]